MNYSPHIQFHYVHRNTYHGLYVYTKLYMYTRNTSGNVNTLEQICGLFLILIKTENLNTLKGVEIKCQLDATEVFIADLIACSTCFGHHYAHHQELKSIIQRLLPVVFRAVVFQVACLVWS